MASLHAVNAATDQVLSIRQCRTMAPQVVTLIAGCKRQSLLMAGDDDKMSMTSSLNSQRYAKDNGTAFNCMQ